MTTDANIWQATGAVPAPNPLTGPTASPTNPPPPDSPPEPILKLDNIQGNILSGFNKDFQTLLFLTIDDAAAFKMWLATQVRFIATADEVLAFNNLFKATRKRRKREGYVKATWTNIAFNFQGLSLLTGDASQFTDEAFKKGLPQSAAALHDPVDAQGNPIGWVVGAKDESAHVVFIIAADDHADMLAEVERIVVSLTRFEDGNGNPLSSGAHIAYRDEGANLPPPLGGHEHFGTHDGISQPGIRGRVQGDPDVFITPRQNPDDPLQGKPGQDRLWPGEFVFGYNGQNPNAATLDDSMGDITSAGPAWANDGSFLVFRRLRQDVFKFHSFLLETGTHLHADPRRVSAKLVGRWPSGAPTVRTYVNDDTPEQDDFAMGNNDCANNDFEFNGSSAPAAPPVSGPDDCVLNRVAPTNDAFAPSTEATGVRCPFIAHTRKAYPRNDKTPGGMTATGKIDVQTSEVTTQTHRFLRRGIPYGPVSASTPNAPVQDMTPDGKPLFVDRGLHFLCYQTSIVRGFEFVTKNWVNNPTFSTQAAQGHETPDGQIPLGADPVIGQVNNGGDRTRQFFIRLIDNEGGARYEQLTAPQDWVIPTGGGYFFSPSISALDGVLTTAAPALPTPGAGS